MHLQGFLRQCTTFAHLIHFKINAACLRADSDTLPLAATTYWHVMPSGCHLCHMHIRKWGGRIAKAKGAPCSPCMKHQEHRNLYCCRHWHDDEDRR